MSESWTQDIRVASLELDQVLWEGFLGWWQVEYLDGVPLGCMSAWNVVCFPQAADQFVMGDAG